MKVKLITHPSGDQLPLLVNEDGLPIPSPNEFIIGRRSLSTNTLTRNLRELAVLYNWLINQKINLHDRILSEDFFSEAEIKGSLIESIRREQNSKNNVKKIAISPHTFNQRLTTIRQYIAWCFDIELGSCPLTDARFDRIREHKNRVLKWLENSFINAPPINKKIHKGLSIDESRFLINILNPENPNSFGRDPAVRFRNYVATIIMLYYGLRPGELLSLRVEDIQIGAISNIRVERRLPDPFDKRKPRPQIKRNGRVLVIEDISFVRCLDKYIMTWREELENNSKKSTDYLILSDEGEPLSQPSIVQFYQVLRNRYPDNLPSHLTAKALRHTFSSQMERTLRKSGIDEERRREALAFLRGDSSLESQSIYIAQEVEDQATLALQKYQRNLWMK